MTSEPATSATNDTSIPRPGGEAARLTAKADFGVFVTDALRIRRENRGFRSRRLTEQAKSRQPGGSRIAAGVCDAKRVEKVEFRCQPDWEPDTAAITAPRMSPHRKSEERKERDARVAQFQNPSMRTMFREVRWSPSSRCGQVRYAAGAAADEQAR
jgi:hypothetical protein